MKLAWCVTWCGEKAIIAAETRGQALFRTLDSIHEAGYRPTIGELHCRRAPEWDEWAAVESSRACWNPEYLPKPRHGAVSRRAGG
jgi:hypothetical protein